MISKIAYFLLGVVAVAAVYLAFTLGKEPIEPNPVRRKSPTAIANIVHQPTNTYIKIVYGQPYKRGREIFGGIVKYDEIWRTGANESTELTVTNDILFAGKKLNAGTYSLFTIPRKDEPWTLVLNSRLGQWGDFQYEREYDVFRVKVQAEKKETVTEAFTIRFSGIDSNPTNIPLYKKDTTNIIIVWGKIKVTVPVKFLNN